MEKYMGYYNRMVWYVVHMTSQESDLYKFKIDTFKTYKNKEISKKKFMQRINQLGARAKQRIDKAERDAGEKAPPKLTKKEISEIRKDLLEEYRTKDWK